MLRIASKLRNVWSLFSGSPATLVDSTPALVEDIPPNYEDGWSWIPKWHEIFNGQTDEWSSFVASSRSGAKVLIASCTGGNSALTPIESLLAVALTLRGAAVDILLCDKAVPACMNVLASEAYDQKDFLSRGPDKCDWCFEAGLKAYKQLGLPVYFLGQWIEEADRLKARELAQEVSLENASRYIENGIPVGEQAVAGALRYLGRGDFNDEPLALEIVRRFLEAAIIANSALHRLYEKYGYQHTVVNHGLYVPQGIVVGVAKKYHSTVATWDLAYRNKSINMDSKDTFVRTLIDEPNDVWESMPWSDEMEQEIVDYLKSRWKGTYDWLKLQSEQGPDSASQISQEVGIDYRKPTIGLLTNVVWDAQVFFSANAFPSMLDWLINTIRYFESRPDLQLLIRVHPGELKGWVISRQLAVNEIKRTFPTIPSNVFVIPPDSHINTYAAMMPCNAILIYATSAGLELASMGFPVIVAGEAWIKNRGFSVDVSSEAEYFAALDQLPLLENKLSPDKLQRARKYAYHNYFRKMIPLEMLEPQNSDYVPYTIGKVGIDGFLPGKDPGLDTICNGILNNADFIYPHETGRKPAVAAHSIDMSSSSASRLSWGIGNKSVATRLR